MKIKIWRLVAVCAAVLMAGSLVWAQREASPFTPEGGTKNATARAKCEEGWSLESKRDFVPAVADFEAALKLDPNYFSAHDGFIMSQKMVRVYDEMSASYKAIPDTVHTNTGALVGKKVPAFPFGGGPATAELSKLYGEKLSKEPNSPLLNWAMGQIVQGTDNAKAEEYYKKAIAVDPKFAPAYSAMSVLMRVMNKPEDGYMKKAVDIDPNNPDLLSNYAGFIKQSDPAEANRIWLEIAKRFPTDQQAEYAYLNLSFNTKNEVEKMGYLEHIWKDFPQDTSISRDWTLKTLFHLYQKYAPEKAVELAKNMSVAISSDGEWKTMLAYQEQFNRASDLVKSGKFKEASTLINTIKVPIFLDTLPYFMLKAEAEGAGSPSQAYQILLAVAAKAPNSSVEAALSHYGAELKKTPEQINADIWNLRLSKAPVFKDFDLDTYTGSGKIKLSDYRGKIVLVNFWFPGCGPCLAEFPRVQDVLKKYKDKGFVVLAINTMPNEDNQVLEIMQKNGYGFIPLKSPEAGWSSKIYNVYGTPSNFLLDGEGRVVFTPSVHDAESEHVFDQEVGLLIQRNEAVKAASEAQK